jgi:hypothetical protein
MARFFQMGASTRGDGYGLFVAPLMSCGVRPSPGPFALDPLDTLR